MVKHRRLNKRLDAPHVRLYRWILDSPAYLSLSCQARAVLLEIARGHDGTNQRQARPLNSPGFRAMQHCSGNRRPCLRRTPGMRFHRLHDQRWIQPERPARQRMAAHMVELRGHWGAAQQKVHELGPRKTKRGSKISRRGIKSEPPCRMKRREKSLTVPRIDTVRARYTVVAVSIQGTHIVYHRA